MSAKILSIVLLSVGGSTVAGVLTGLLFRHIPHRLNDIVLGFAAGVMLAASVLGLIEPAFSGTGGDMLLALGGIVAGAGLISLLDRIVPHLHRIAGVDTESHRSNGSISKIVPITIIERKPNAIILVCENFRLSFIVKSSENILN